MMSRKLNSLLSNLLINLRFEDIIAGAFALGLFFYVGALAFFQGILLDENNYGDISFIIAPLALLTFLIALRYAIGRNRLLIHSTLSSIGNIFRDWLPFLFFLLFYEAFHANVWQSILKTDLDKELLWIDRHFFGETPALLCEKIITPVLTDIMAIAYFLHLVLPPLIAFMLYLRSKYEFRRFLLAILIAGILASIGYIIVPAVGPGIAFQELFTKGLKGFFYAPVTIFMDAARAPRDVFPSLHVAVSTIVLIFGAKLGRKWFWILLPLVFLNWVSTMYLRYHYFIDVIAGWLAVALTIYLVGKLLNLETYIKHRYLHDSPNFKT